MHRIDACEKNHLFRQKRLNNDLRDISISVLLFTPVLNGIVYT